MPRFHVKITGKDYDAMADLVRKYSVNVARHTVEKVGAGYRIDAHATGRQLTRLEAAGYVVERYENADKEGKARQKEVRKKTKTAANQQIQVLTPGASDLASKGFLNDILSDSSGYSFHRFQIFAWTIVLGIMFLSSVYNNLTMPEFSATLLGLMGISSGTYIGFKFPEVK